MNNEQMRKAYRAEFGVDMPYEGQRATIWALAYQAALASVQSAKPVAWSALQAVIDYPITGEQNMDVANMKMIAIRAMTANPPVAPASQSQVTSEYGWLIENGKNQGSGLAYRFIDNDLGGIPSWTEDHNKALRFSRRADAEQFAHHDEDAWRIVEHAWDSAPLASQPQVEQMAAWLASDEGKAAIQNSVLRSSASIAELDKARTVDAEMMHTPFSQAERQLTDAEHSKLIDAIADALGDAMDCTRTWSAWEVGTMSKYDFQLVADDDDRLAEIADAAISVLLSTASTQQPGEKE